MKDVFRKLAEFLGLDKQTEQPPVHDEHVVDRDIRQDVQVRTKVIYPSNRNNQASSQFRFPIIADEVYQEKKPVEMESPKRVQVTPATRANKPDAVPKEKKPFKPTEVVSPVYGRVNTRERKDSHTLEVQAKLPSHSILPSPISNPQRLVNKPLVEQKEDEETTRMLKAAVQQEAVTQEVVITYGEVIIPDEVAVEEKAAAIDEVLGKQDESANRLRIPMGQAKIIAFPQREDLKSNNVEETGEAATDFQEPLQPVVYMQKDTQPTPVPLQENIRLEPAVSLNDNKPTVEARKNESVDHYQFPYLNYLKREPPLSSGDEQYTEQQIEKLVVALENFNVKAEVIGVVQGPTVTRYELQPAPGVKVNKFTNLIDDIKLALAAKDIRMEAPIPGRSAIGIEVPNEISSPVFIRSVLESEEFITESSPLAVALGRDISGAPVIGDLKKMPHGLIAGSTGSGKSVCVNSIIISLLYKAKPEDVRLILIDPKVVEMAPYNHIPHLLTPVVTDPKQATAALKWAVEEMDGRYEKFAETGARDIERYNALALRQGREKLPYIVIVIDELADLMMVAPHDVEESICRIAQKARACGIHLLIATQRPSVDVITGLIKANIPTRIAFSVSSQVDSRTILDMAGAERLLGKGDMLYYPSGMAKPVRLQGNFVSDDEIERVIDHVKAQQKTVYLFDKEELTRAASSAVENDDALFEEALMFVIEQGQASSSSLQRRFRIGYNRAARLVDMMETEGFISGQSGSKPRDVLISIEEYRNLMG